MKYMVGTNQKIILYTARFSSRFGCLLCKNNIQNAVNGIVDHNTNHKFFGICEHNTFFVLVLWNISSLYSTLLTLDTKYGVKIKATINFKWKTKQSGKRLRLRPNCIKRL